MVGTKVFKMLKTTKFMLPIAIAFLSIMPSKAQENQAEAKKEKTITLKMPKLFGMINGRYQYSDESGFKNGFDMRHVRLGASGELTDNLDYFVQAEFETKVRILDAYVRWKIKPYFNLKVGEFKVPMSQETMGGPLTWIISDLPLSVNRLNGYKDISNVESNGRDIGFQFYGSAFNNGSFNYLTYWIGMVNGDGINTSAKKNDKDFFAQVYFQPIKEVTISASHYQGRYVEQNNTDITHVRIRSACGISYNSKHIDARTEYIYGNTAGMKSNGCYAYAGYKFGNIEPVLAFDHFKEDKDADIKQNSYQFAINWTPIKNTRVQASYALKTKTGCDNVNYVTAQLIIGF